MADAGTSEIERVLAENASLRAELAAERERATQLEGERDRLRKAYEALKVDLELLRRKIFAAKAERVDATQLELEFAKKLAEVDALAGKLGGEQSPPPARERKLRKPPTGRRDLANADLPVDRIEITDPVMEQMVAEGRAEAMGFEESSRIGYRRASHTRVVVARRKYAAARTTRASPPRSRRHRCRPR